MVHWADTIAGELLSRGGEHRVATGITPSGHIHIGNMREVVTGDAVFRALLDHDADADLIYIADTYDPLRKVYPFLPDSYERYVGHPLSEIPCPGECHGSYAEHFLMPFLESLEALDIHPQVYRADRMYKEGMYTQAIKTALERRDEIAGILAEESQRDIPDGWSPYTPICQDCGGMKGQVTGYDLDGELVFYECECGVEGEAAMAGGGKLSWRVDWPARWKILGVTVEPFGKDHAAAGGSYDTGERIAREIYDYEPPYPIVYEWIMLKGEGAMSSSKGVTVGIKDMLEVLPPEVLRYLVIRTRPEKHIEFDPGMPLLNLIDEYDNPGEDTRRSHELSQTRAAEDLDIPFRHMVTIVQTAQSEDQIIEILHRSGYEVKDKRAVLRRAENARAWVRQYAPPFVKFEVKQEMPSQAKNLSREQKEGLRLLASRVDGTAEDVHNAVYDVAEDAGLSAKELFQAIYVALLGQKSGPRAGWFITSLDREFVRERFLSVAKA